MADESIPDTGARRRNGNHEFYQLLQTDIDEYAISFLMHSEGCTREDAELAYDKFIKNAK